MVVVVVAVVAGVRNLARLPRSAASRSLGRLARNRPTHQPEDPPSHAPTNFPSSPPPHHSPTATIKTNRGDRHSGIRSLLLLFFPLFFSCAFSVLLCSFCGSVSSLSRALFHKKLCAVSLALHSPRLPSPAIARPPCPVCSPCVPSFHVSLSRAFGAFRGLIAVDHSSAKLRFGKAQAEFSKAWLSQAKLTQAKLCWAKLRH